MKASQAVDVRKSIVSLAQQREALKHKRIHAGLEHVDVLGALRCPSVDERNNVRDDLELVLRLENVSVIDSILKNREQVRAAVMRPESASAMAMLSCFVMPAMRNSCWRAR